MEPTNSAISAYSDLNRFSREDKEMVYDKDMCKSKLGILMCAFRADRPSEWQMDEFIHHAEDMNKKINELTKQRDELLVVLHGMIDIANDSQGVAGYHLNSEVADWGEFEEWQAACDAISKAKVGAANHFPDAAKMVQDGWQLVPVEPTTDMVQAATHSAVGFGTRAAYQAMLAAAPKLEGGAA